MKGPLMRFPFPRRAEKAPAVAPVPEARDAALPSMVQSNPALVSFLGMMDGATSEPVTIDSALGLTPIWSAVNFLSRTLASLPVKVYERQADGGRKAISGHPLAALLNGAANDETTAFAWRQSAWGDTFTAGRQVSWIERNGRGDPINLWPLEVAKVTLRSDGGRLTYFYRDGSALGKTYRAADILDLAFMPGATRLTARGPIASNAKTVALALAVTKYGAKFFDQGGIPPFTISGPMRTAGGAARASADLTQAVAKLANEGGHALALPDGHALNVLGFDPEKMQMVEVKRLLVEEFARIYQMPPAFLQDLTHGTFSNVEQQDLQLVKHVLSPWVKAWEAEANLKLFGRAPGNHYLETSLDAILRGDLLSRSEALAKRIASGQLTPNEGRELDNRPALPGGDVLFMQGAMAPVATLAQGETKPEGNPDE